VVSLATSINPDDFKIVAVKQVTECGHTVADIASRSVLSKGIPVVTPSSKSSGRHVHFEINSGLPASWTIRPKSSNSRETKVGHDHRSSDMNQT
jgi:hypothetical protein